MSQTHLKLGLVVNISKIYIHWFEEADIITVSFSVAVHVF